MTYCARACSFSSCWRSGCLSMDRVSSRTSHGKGLRRTTRPSFPTSVNMNPRGRNSRRIALRAAGSASVMTTTSRSTNSFIRSANSSNCCPNAGSAGASAKTTTRRATHLNSAGSTSFASKTVVGSAVHRSKAEAPGVVPSVAKVADANSPTASTTTDRMVAFGVIMSPSPLNIGLIGEKRRGFLFSQSVSTNTTRPKEFRT